MMDDKRLEEEALEKLLDTIREKISAFSEGGYEEKPEGIDAVKEEVEEESPELAAVESEQEGEDEEEEDTFKNFLEGKTEKDRYMPKGKMAGMSASIEIKKPLAKGRKY